MHRFHECQGRYPTSPSPRSCLHPFTGFRVGQLRSVYSKLWFGGGSDRCVFCEALHTHTSIMGFNKPDKHSGVYLWHDGSGSKQVYVGKGAKDRAFCRSHRDRFNTMFDYASVHTFSIPFGEVALEVEAAMMNILESEGYDLLNVVRPALPTYRYGDAKPTVALARAILLYWGLLDTPEGAKREDMHKSNLMTRMKDANLLYHDPYFGANMFDATDTLDDDLARSNLVANMLARYKREAEERISKVRREAEEAVQRLANFEENVR